MFNQTFVDGAGKTKKPLTIAVSVVIEIAVLCFLILIPLVYTHALPVAQLRDLLVAPVPPVAMPPTVTTKVQARPTVRRLNTTQLLAPFVIPNRVNPINEPAPALDTAVVGSTGTASIGSSVVGSVIDAPPDVEPPPGSAPPKPPSGPIRVTRLSEANLIRKVEPVYPPMARSARVQGVVEFTAIISKEGNIEHLQLVRGHPLLVNAAREAVLQWRYRPTLLNGRPVEVITDIIVKFRLNQ